MLKSFEVKDYALIEHISVEFGGVLNIITGETGAGKSILIDAMGLLLGERAATEVVRKGANKSVVEGIFNIEENKNVKKLLEDNDIEYYPELILRREISLKGSNRCFANDTPVSLSIIKELGNLLVDLHGQHEHQSLLRTETHINYLDEFGDYDDLMIKYRKTYDDLVRTERELNSLKEREEILKEKKEICSFQIKEIDEVSMQEGEEEKLNGELIILENSEKLAELTNEIYQLLYESGNSVHDSVVKVQNNLSELVEIDNSFSDSSSEAETIIALVNDISSFVQSYKAKVDLDPAHVEEIRERLGSINLLKKRYGGTVKSVLEHRKKIGEEFTLAENFEEKISELSSALSKLREKAEKEAKSISQKRIQVSKKVKSGIENSLKELGISQPEFKTEILNEPADGKPLKFSSTGIDKVEFFISTNPGEDPKPLAKVASGGEVSRIMLSLKSVLAMSDKLPLLIFDEIDVGVSGKIAQKVGNTLKELSKYHQIIAITHLPQIASLADSHYSIEKISKKDRVISSIKKLDEEEQVKEVAKLISGEKITDKSISTAQELIGLNRY
jgi:DNA repair protein RecN (Recombination protein N)